MNKLIYIASPYAGAVDHNTEFAKEACRYCIEEGDIPVAVHLLYPQILDDRNPEERKIGLSLGIGVMERCDEVWVCGERISSGMAQEVLRAEELRMPIRQISSHDIWSQRCQGQQVEVNRTPELKLV